MLAELADAFAAERLRFFRARGLTFWGVLFVPIVSLVFGLGGTVLTMTNPRLVAAGVLPPHDLLKAAAEAMTSTDMIPVQLFFMLMAAALFADDYRWETWRLVTPRNTRANLLLAKLQVFGIGSAISIALLALVAVVIGTIDAMVTGSGFAAGAGATEGLTRLGGSFLTSWLELNAMAALAGLVAVLTRNAIPAVIGSMGLWLAQLFVIDRITRDIVDPSAVPLHYFALLPAFAADVLRNVLLTGLPDSSRPAGWVLAFVFLAAWTALFMGLAIVLFRRQDLTRE